MTLHGSFWVKVQISKALDIRQLKQNQVSKQGSKYEAQNTPSMQKQLCDCLVSHLVSTGVNISSFVYLYFEYLCFFDEKSRVGIETVGIKLFCQTVAICAQRESIWTVLCPLTGHQWAPMGTDQIEMLRALHHKNIF